MRRGSSLGALSNSKVANELFASASSAKVHHVPVYSKLGVDDRIAAVAAALWSACYCRSIRDCCPAQRSTGPGAGVRGMTIWPDPERCQMKRRRGTGAYFGVAELVFGIA